jgi:putative membrane protein
MITEALTTVIVPTRRDRHVAPRRDAEARLASRYVSGDIDENEYRARPAVLREKD